MSRVGLAVTLLAVAGLPLMSLPVISEPWELATELPGARYTYDLMTTPSAVYMVLGDSLGATRGLYRYWRDTRGLDFVGKPADVLRGVHVAGANDEHIWLGSKDIDTIWYSPDAGETWIPREASDAAGLWAITGSETGDRLYSSDLNSYCFQTSTDQGETWHCFGDCNENAFFGTKAMEVDTFDPTRAYALNVFSIVGELYFLDSTDGGDSWEFAFSTGTVPSYAGVYPSPFQSGDVGIAEDYGQIYTRVGGQWSPLPDTNLDPVYGIAQPVWDGGAWWMAGEATSQLHVGRYAGNHWEEWSDGLPHVPIFGPEIHLHKARLWACPLNGDVFLTLPDKGLWVYQNPTSAAPDLELSTAVPWMLSYPNPFRSQVHLALGSLQPDLYRLEVYDVRGRWVKTLYHGSLEGTSNCNWDGRDASGQVLPNGFYLLDLTDSKGIRRLSDKVLLLNR